jgi:hypothetical protein
LVIGYSLALSLSERAYGSLAVPSPFWLPDSVLLSTATERALDAVRSL